jgi:hypothetical protein
LDADADADADDIIGVFVVFCAKPFSPAAAAAGEEEEEEDTF